MTALARSGGQWLASRPADWPGAAQPAGRLAKCCPAVLSYGMYVWYYKSSTGFVYITEGFMLKLYKTL